MSITNIYILKLEGNKFYVGYSSDIKKRIQEHIDGNGSSFTKKYKPIGVEKIKENVPEDHANKYVIKYMKKYGIDNVRGGSYKGSSLNKDQLLELSNNGIKLEVPKKDRVLKIPIKNANGTCYRCMKDGHYQESCRETHDKNGNFMGGDLNIGDNELDSYFQYDPQDKKIDNEIFR
jgi:hypothetical protein